MAMDSKHPIAQLRDQGEEEKEGGDRLNPNITASAQPMAPGPSGAEMGTVPVIGIDDLPSNFLPYPSDVVIQYTPYTYGEVLDLNQPNLKNWQKFSLMLKGVRTTGMDVRDLTLMDFMYIGVARKVSTLGQSEFRALFTCKNEDCGERNDAVINTTMLDFEYIKAAKLPLVLKSLAGHSNLAFSPVTIGQMIDMWSSGNDSTAHMMAAQLCGQVRDGKLEPVDQGVVFRAIYNAMGDDARHLRMVDEWLFHGLNPIQLRCSRCQTLSSIELDSWEAVLIPFRGQAESDEDFFSFGLEGGG